VRALPTTLYKRRKTLKETETETELPNGSVLANIKSNIVNVASYVKRETHDQVDSCCSTISLTI